MLKRTSARLISVILTIAMIFSVLLPTAAFAVEITDYRTFLADLKVLEGYAKSYAASNSGKDTNELMINFVRTGVDRYNDGNWKTLAGEEITAFTSYVEAQDAANGTTVMDLRDIEEFTIPNGDGVDFGHMFGTLNIAYVASQASADLGGWAGDICDLMIYSKDYGNVPEGTVEEMAAYILANCFGVDADDAFGMDDFYGDMDAYYLNSMVKSGASLSETFEAYFTESLTNSDRAAYFLNNRFSALETKEDVRNAIYDAYAANVGLQVLEADRGLTDDADLRTACCYAFADYLFDLAGDRLEGDTGDEGGEGGETPDTPAKPDEPEMDNDYYSVFSSTASTLAPGITQTINYAQTVDNKQIVYYVATVDVTRDDVTVMANYKDNDPSAGWGMQRVEEQAAALVAKHTDPTDTENYIENFNAIVATNADGYNMSTGEPGGLLVMEGVEWHPIDGDGFFAILKDGSAMIGTKADYETCKDQIREGIGAFGATLVKDGEMAINKTGSYYSTRASRTAIGITADGKVVMMVLDGRQEPFSAGGSMEEIAQIMLDAGCVDAINLDGGGSTTYLSKPEGEDELTLINRPSDGFARSVSTSLVAVSTAKSSKEFDHANISSDYEYLTVGTSLTLTATGVSNTGYSAPIPEDAVWQVSDSSVGSVTADGVFTAAANGDVDIQLVSGENVIGSKTLHVVVPDALVATPDKVNAVFGVPTELSFIASYNGSEVAYHDNDIMFVLMDESLTNTLSENVGYFDGLSYIGNEEVGLRNLNAVAILVSNPDIGAIVALSMYKNGEATFDFDHATSGNRQFAWLREVSNSETKDDILYQIVDTDESMDIDYTFALDMTQIEIPEQLSDLTYMLPGADTGATAWDFLLQLAERVSILTEVRITAQFDPSLDVDVNEMQVINEYFELTSAELGENNKLTLVCNWIDQTAAIDPATANSICILSGIKLTPKDGAAWDSKDQLSIVNSGEVSYNIYLRASALYSFSSKPANQEKYGLYPYSSSETGYEGGTEKGASFGQTYASFSDEFTLDSTNRNGWYNVDSQLYYYVDNKLIEAGVHGLPSYEDPTIELWYEFDENGACHGKYTGLIEKDGKVMYAMQGELRKGWQSVMDSNGESYFYYFDPYTYAAVGAGDGWITVEGYSYHFIDYKCMEGSVVSTSGGLKYRFAGNWQRNQWFELNGNTYFVKRDYYLAADGLRRVRAIDASGDFYHLFDENGVWQKDYTGLYHVGDDTYYIENGIRGDEPGIVYIDGYYYYFCSTAKAIKNCTYWPTKTNGLIPVGPYVFDEYGRITNPPAVEPEEPDVPVDPVKDGIVSENGVLYYYKDGAIAYCAGLIQLEDGSYIYVRSNGKLATGNYWITTTNDLLPAGLYTFGEDGKMILSEEPEEPDAKNGIYYENGAYYYYVNGSIGYSAGLVLVDGSYYYIRSNGQAAVGNYWVTNSNGLLENGLYTFAADGKMVIDGEEPDTPVEPDEPEVKNGVVNENGILYYYKDGARAYCAGLVELRDDDGVTYYIYVRSNAQLAIGSYWPTNTNGLLPAQSYVFDANGRYYPLVVEEPDEPETPDVKNGIVDEDGTLYYYIDGTRAYGAGVVKLTDENGEEFYIYVRSNGQLATGVYWPTTTNGLLECKGYDWGTDGRLYLRY